MQMTFTKSLLLTSILFLQLLSINTFATPLTTLTFTNVGASSVTATGTCVSGYYATFGTSSTSYWQYTVSTTGYSGITMQFHSSSSGTGPTTGQIWYNTGCGGPDVFSGITYSVGACAIKGPYTLPAACNNIANLTVKLIMSGGSGSAGTNRVDNNNVFSGTATAFPSVAISSTSPAPGSIFTSSTNNLIETFDLATTVATATLSGLTIITSGTYIAADITALKCWYDVTPVFNPATATLLSTFSAPGGPGSKMFPSFTAQNIPAGTTGYVFITADVSPSGIGGHTISIAATSFCNINLGSATMTGISPVAASNTQTINSCTAPAPITGSTLVCPGAAISLSDPTLSGNWSSSNTSVATVGVLSGIVSGLTAGTTTISYSTGAGCAAAIIVTVNPAPASISGNTNVCVSTTSPLSDAGGGTWTSSTSSVATIDMITGVVSGIAPGTSTITYTLGSGCSITTTVTVNPLPGAITGTTVLCGGTTTALSDAGGGGTWSSGTTTVASVGLLSGIVTGNTAGTATISYTLSTGCAATATVTVLLAPTVITGLTTLCNGVNTTLSNGLGGGTWTSGNTSVATINPGTGFVTTIASGSSVITYTLSTGCAITGTVTVNSSPLPITGITAVCIGLTATLSDATLGGTWSSSNTSVAPIGSTSGLYSGVSAGTATITYTAPVTGCTVTSIVTVNLLPPTIGGNKNVCLGGQTVLLGGGGGGTWTSSNTAVATVNTLGVVSGISLGTASITYTIGTGCATSTTVTVNPLPPGITGVTNVCPGTTTTLSDIPGGTWSSGTTTIATVGLGSGTVTGSIAGTATITYTSSLGCIATAPVTVNPLPLPITGITSVCTGLTTTLSDASPSGTWTSLNTTVAIVGGGSGIVLGSLAGTAIIAYTISTGCTITTTVTINSLPSAITGTLSVCPGLTTTLSNIVGGTWSSSSISVADFSSSLSGILSGITAGTATITFTAAGTGCTGTATATVNPLPAPISGLTSVCVGAAITLSDASTGGTWSTGSTIIFVGTSSGSVSGFSAGLADITYTLPVSGCITSTYITVNPTPPITGIPYICTGSSALLSPPITGGTWTSSITSVATVGAGSGMLTGVSTGTSIITYTFTTGCAVFSTIMVNPFPSAISGLSLVCTGDTATMNDIPAGGTWSSSSPGIAIVNVVSGLVKGVSVGATIITYSNGTGCSVIKTVSVNTAAAPITGIGANMCSGSTGNAYNVDTPYGIWTSALVTITPAGLVSAYRPGAATITYTLPTGCFTTLSVTVVPLPAKITGVNAICTGVPVPLSDTTSGGGWSSIDTTVGITFGTGIVTGLYPGTAAIRYTLPTGCFQADTITIFPMPSAILGKVGLCLGGTTSLSNATGGGVWKSLSPSIASISSGAGIVTGISTGAAIISYTIGPACTVTQNVTVEPLPAVYGVTGGGSFCSGGTGVHVLLSGSAPGIKYKLFNGGTFTDSLLGTGSPLDYGLFTVPGTYTISAANIATGCSSVMVDSAAVNIDPMVAPSVSIVTSPGEMICSGIPASYNAVPVNGGSLPAYQWRVNGITVGGSSASYSYTPANGDVIAVMLTSNATCVAPATTYTLVTMSVMSQVVPAVTISADPGTIVQEGQLVKFTASVINSGAAPTYQWMKNGVQLEGETLPTYTSNSFSNDDSVRCIVTGSDLCSTAASSETIYMNIFSEGIQQLTPQANINVVPNPNKGAFLIKGSLGATDENVTLEITDMLGQLVYNDHVMAFKGYLNKQVKIANNIANGMYLLTVHSGSVNKVFHIIIQQ